jgi:hypothetical protein
MKTIKLAVLPFTLLAAAALLGGCAEDGTPDEPTPGGRVETAGEAGSEKPISESSDMPDEMTTLLAASSQSWRRSCDAAFHYFDKNGHYYRLDAHCKMRSGSWRWSTFNNPLSCTGDLANCNGQLHCGRC